MWATLIPEIVLFPLSPNVSIALRRHPTGTIPVKACYKITIAKTLLPPQWIGLKVNKGKPHQWFELLGSCAAVRSYRNYC